MSDELWVVTGIEHHHDGWVTLTMQNERGNTRTENYLPGTMLTRAIFPSEDDA